MDSILLPLLPRTHTVTTGVSCVGDPLDLSSKIIGVKKNLLILFSVVPWLSFVLNFIDRSANYRKIKFLAFTG